MKIGKVVLGVVLAWPGLAQALELDYYTYNAFNETRDAFTRLALIFSDTSFLGFVFVFAVMGIIVGALMAGAHGIAGGRVNPLGWLWPILLGMVLFKGVIMPTGRIDIYDPVVNAYQPVDGVPDAVILIAGLFNKIERGVVQIVDTAGGTPYAQDAGSIDFSLINAAMGIPITAVNLDRSMSQYFSDCGTLALSMNNNGNANANSNGVPRQEFFRNTDDLYTTYAKFANPAVYTTYYADGSDVGNAMTCADAWANISPLLEDGSQSFYDMANATCRVAGFDPADTAQMASCQAQLTNVSSMYGVVAANSFSFLRSMALAKSASEAMNGPDFSMQQRMLINRQTMAEGFGVAQAANQWIPKLRGFITAAILGLVPLVLLFTVTPLVFRALALVAGLFIWLTLWGICDATAVVMARDAAVSAFSEIKNYHFGYDAIMNTPDAVLQSLGVFGKARTMAMGLATVISGALFHFAGYAFTQIGQNMQAELDRAGGQAGAQTLQPEQHAALLGQLTGSAGPQAALSAAGFRNAAFGAATGSIREAITGGYMSDRLAGSSASASPSGSAMGAGSDLGPSAVLPRGSTEVSEAKDAGSGRGPSVSGTASPTTGPGESDAATAEVTVSARRPRSGPTPFQVLSTQAESSAGGQIGTADAQMRASSDLSRPVGDIAQQIHDYETTLSTYSSLASRDERAAILGGVPAAGKLLGGIEGAKSSVFQEIYRNINKTDQITAEGVRNVARQLDGAAVGVSRASSDPDVYIRASEESQRVLNAYADALEKSGGANTVGAARALQEIVQSKGFDAALAVVGSTHLIEGSAWSQTQSAETGAAAYKAADGDIAGVARNIGNVGVASQVAQSRVAREVTSILGFDPRNVKGLVRGEELMQGHMSVAVPPEYKARVLSQLVKANLVDPKHLDEIRQEQGFGINFEVADGKPLTATISAGSRTYNSRTVEVAEGISRTTSDSVQFDYRKDIQGNIAIAPHLDQLLLKAYGGNIGRGAPDAAWLSTLGQNVGGFATAQGVSLGAAVTQSETKAVDGELSVAPPGSKVLKLLKVLPADVKARYSFQSGTNSQQSTHLDNTAAAIEIIEQERQRAVGQYERVGSAARGDQVALSQIVEQRVINRMGGLVTHAHSEADEAAHRNEALSGHQDGTL